jgi:hypothetical protein
VRVEFLRQSRDDRITLVLDESAAPVPSLWGKMIMKHIPGAVESLRSREGTATKYIGQWTVGAPSPTLIPDLSNWATGWSLDAVIWTNLGRKFHDLDRPATADEVISHLGQLTGEKRDAAERYVRRAPRQIDTKYRRKIAAALGWH